MNSNPSLIVTHRLYLNRMTADDAKHAFDLNNDQDVIRYTGDPPFDSVESARTFLERYTGYDESGYGRFAVRLLKGDHFLGWCGLKRTDEMQEVDLGFRFMKEYWNQGYATEAARACLRHGFDSLGLSRIIGRAMHANGASIHVLEKIGMTYWKDAVFDRHPARCYKIEKQEFHALDP